ncbi:MAG: DNA methyltransferase [Candidatus Omnitrophota bacterium]
MDMSEINNTSIHLIVTSPPYYNAPFDHDGLFTNYEQYLGVLTHFAKESYRVLKEGRIVVLNIDDMIINGTKYPIVADAIKIFQNAGFRYRDRIIWKKPDGYLRISKRSGTTMKVARLLKRNSGGIEIIRDLEKIIRKKTGFDTNSDIFNNEDNLEILERKTGKHKFVTLQYIEKKKPKESK